MAWSNLAQELGEMFATLSLGDEVELDLAYERRLANRRAQRRAANSARMAAIKSDPAAHAAYLAEQKNRWAARLERIKSDPEAYEKLKATWRKRDEEKRNRKQQSK